MFIDTNKLNCGFWWLMYVDILGGFDTKECLYIFFGKYIFL
jgi:hypothetical protein